MSRRPAFHKQFCDEGMRLDHRALAAGIPRDQVVGFDGAALNFAI